MAGAYLNLGCFKKTLKGYVNIDLTCEKADVLCDMREYVPGEQVVDVRCMYSLGFLEEPYEMLERICGWLRFGGHLSLVVRETEKMEKYIKTHEVDESIIRNGKGLYGEGIIRKNSFNQKELEGFLKERGFRVESYISGPDINLEAYKIFPKAKRMFFIFGVPAVGKTTAVKSLIVPTPPPDRREIHISEDWKFSTIGKNKRTEYGNGYEGLTKAKRLLLLKVAASLTENVIFECCTASKAELDKIEEFCENHRIEFISYEFVSSEVEKRRKGRIARGHKSNGVGYAEENVKKYRKRYRNPKQVHDLEFLKAL